jgi:hypothetical protein
MHTMVFPDSIPVRALYSKKCTELEYLALKKRYISFVGVWKR